MTSHGPGQEHVRRLLDAGRLLVSDLDSDEVLDRVLEAAREVTGAQYAALGVLDEDHSRLDRFITSGVDEGLHRQIGDLPTGKGVLGVLIRDPKPLRLNDVSDHVSSAGFPPNHPPMRTFLGVPISIRGVVFGNLYLTEKADGASFTEADETAASVLAEWAAVAIDRTRSAAESRLKEGIAAYERERGRWSRELHDETLQGMGAIRVLLASGLRQGAGPGLERAVEEGIAQLSEEIDRLRGLITDLRPAALDELGLGAALEDVRRRAELRDHTHVRMAIALAYELGIEENRLDPELESTVYRFVQESLRNAGRHAQAELISVNLVERDDFVMVTVEDDGVGFDTGARPSGFGLRGLRERVALRGGTFSVRSEPGEGTTLTATLPVVRAESVETTEAET
jgi:signal transduction histidine kinase